MSFNLKPSSGESSFTPYIKFDAKAGRVFVPSPEEDAPDIELEKPRILLDHPTTRSAWICFPVADAPVYHFDVGEQIIPRPNPIGEREFKRGFQIICFVPNVIPGTKTLVGLREWSSTAQAVINAVLRLREQHEMDVKDKPDMLPVYQITGANKVSEKHGGSYEPTFEFEKWQNEADVPGLTELRQQWNAEAVQALGMTPANQDALVASIGESQVPPDDDIPF